MDVLDTEIQKISILVVDDHELVRSGVRRLFDGRADIERVEEAANGEQAVELARQHRFDVVLMDITFENTAGAPESVLDGVEASEQLLELCPDTHIIIVTAKLDGTQITRLLNAGVGGYLSKGCSADEIDRAIQEVLSGGRYLSPDVGHHLATELISGHAENPFERLTVREREIIDRILDGQRNRQIASSLFISEKTVSTHRSRAFLKLRVQTTAELVRLAIKFGIWQDD